MTINKLWKYGALFSLAVCLLLPTGLRTQADTREAGPPKVLWILHEEIKPGKLAEYRQLQEQFIGLYKETGFAYNWVGVIPTEDTAHNEATFFIELNSPSEMEQVYGEFQRVCSEVPVLLAMEQAAQNVIVSQRETLSILRADLSVEAGAGASFFRQSGLMQIATVHLQSGKEMDWTKAIAESTKTLKKTDNVQPSLIYQVISGDNPGAFLVISRATSPNDVSPTKGLERAVSSRLDAEQAQRFSKIISESVQKEETLFYSFDPKISISR